MLRYKDDNGETKNELFRLLDFKNNNLILVKHNPIVKGKASTKAVSYTHLTLPTSDLV